MVCRHDEKGEFVYFYLEVFLPQEGFQADFFRLPELQLFVPCTDSALIIFYLKMSFEKKRTYLKNKKFSSN